MIKCRDTSESKFLKDSCGTLKLTVVVCYKRFTHYEYLTLIWNILYFGESKHFGVPLAEEITRFTIKKINKRLLLWVFSLLFIRVVPYGAKNAFTMPVQMSFWGREENKEAVLDQLKRHGFKLAPPLKGKL